MLTLQNTCRSKQLIIDRKILTSVLKTLIKNSVKKSFYGKKKKIINVLTAFFISHKNDVKTFLK